MSLPVKGFFQTPTPVIMSSSVDIAVNTTAVPNSGFLSYPFRRAVWIEEIRFDLSKAAATATLAANLGALVSAKFHLGPHYLMRDWVPIWLLGTSMDSTYQATPYSQEVGWDKNSSVYSHYRWRLPCPLYVEAGQVLSTFLNRDNDGYAPITVQVTYAGRTAEQNAVRPRQIDIPYVAPFITAVNPSGSYAQSNEKHLFNPFNIPLQIQRLTGRVLNSPAAGIGYSAVTAITPANTTFGSQIQLLMKDYSGHKIVNVLTGPGDIFDVTRSAWTVDVELPAKAMFEVQAWNIDTGYSLHVAMVGSRKERL